MLCGFAGVPGFQIDSGLINQEDPPAAHARGLRSAKAPILWTTPADSTSWDMRARARRMKKRYKIELIVIDYLQLCNCREFASWAGRLRPRRSRASQGHGKELNLP
jgi:replicative DNA helicase